MLPKPKPAPAPAAAPVEAAPVPEPLTIPPWPVESVGPPALVASGDPGSNAFIGPPLVPTFKILDNEVLPGASARLEWNASMSFAGGEVISPITVVHGTRPGPVLCLTAAIHGDELNGVEIVRRVVNAIQPGQLGGTVIGVPIVNLFGFSRNSRYLPDRRDLNRFFPGSRYGSIASRIAQSFFSSVVTHCDALVDFHTGSFDRSNLPQVRADLTLPEVQEFTRGFGATTVLHSDGSKGMLRVAATQAGIPSVTFEVGGPGQLQPDEIGHGVQAIQTLMHKLGMTPRPPDVGGAATVLLRFGLGALELGRVAAEPGAARPAHPARPDPRHRDRPDQQRRARDRLAGVRPRDRHGAEPGGAARFRGLPLGRGNQRTASGARSGARQHGQPGGRRPGQRSRA
ncbi:MAG: succinylglutamate desuccinylase/aspartoacylase family protein [Chiayiivirga sp.]|nr:succinylglutamate desuccinylase/aspartoacylase family protein [Chiayiivirga sp.]